MSALYVEIDAKAAAWLRELIKHDLIASGEVYEGSLEDLTPEECNRYAQVHLCAGIGVWSYALRQAGWPDDRPCWTASFPCQPFSAAGQGAGFADPRHIWPSGFWLIDQCRPVVLLGEQVASRPGLEWFDFVSADLEGSGYAVGAHDLCAAGVGAPHIRQRLYFVADHHRQRRDGCGECAWVAGRCEPSDSGSGSLLADADGGDASAERQQRSGQYGQQSQDRRSGGLVDTESEQAGISRCSRLAGGAVDDDDDARLEGRQFPTERRDQLPVGQAGLDGALQHTEGDGRIERGSEPERRRTAGFWREADWIPCRDGKWRPVESGTFPLAHGAPARVGRLRGYGNALVAPVAEAFIRAYMELGRQ